MTDVDSETQFDAFISYSRTDKLFAKRLRRRISRYRPPRRTGLSSRKLKVFLEVEQLNVGGRLPERLAKNIRASRHLILLCSPSSAASSWVEQEVRTFLSHRGDESVLPILCRGDANISFPPSLATIQPLYLDFRDIAWWRIGKFRLESLRIIAELLEVNYDRLRQEDQTRARQRTWLLAMTSVLIGTFVAAAFVARDVPIQSWVEIPQPASHFEDPLEPIREVAISSYLKSAEGEPVVLYRGINATYVRVEDNAEGGFQYDHLLESEKPGDGLPDLNARFRELVKISPEVRDSFVLLGTQTISPVYRADTFRGVMRMYGYFNSSNQEISWYRDAEFTQQTEHGPPKFIRLPPERCAPWQLSPWPRKPLLEGGINIAESVKMEVAGRLLSTPLSLDVYWYEADEGVAEANAIKLAECIFTNADREKLRVFADGDETLADFEHDRYFWDELATSAGWRTWQSPRTQSFDLGLVCSDESNRERAMLKLRETLAAFQGLADAVFEQIPLGAAANVSVSCRSINPGKEIGVAALTVHHNVEDEFGGTTSLNLLSLPDSRSWKLMTLPGPAALAKDVFVIMRESQMIVVVTEQQGIFISMDSGGHWFDGNFGEAQLLYRDLRLIVVDEQAYVLAVGTGGGETSNPLFRLERKSWLERILAGLMMRVK